MGTRHNKILYLKISLLLIIVLLGGLAFFGCTGVGTVPKGWSGGAIADDTLFVGSTVGKLVAVSTSNGSQLWTASLKSPVSSSSGFGCAPASTAVVIYGTPVINEDLIYVGGYIPLSGEDRGIVFAYNAGRDEPSWLYPKQGVLDGGVVGGLVLSQGKIYFGSTDGKVYALEAEGLFEKWQFETGDKIWSTPTIDGDTLFIGSFDNKLYALSTSDGSKKWEFETEGAIVATPLVYNNTVYIGSFDRHLYAVDATDGSLRWKFPAIEEDTLPRNWFWAKPVGHNDVVYAGCLDGKVYALDAKNGDKLVEFELGSPVTSSPVLVDNSIIVATEDGAV